MQKFVPREILLQTVMLQTNSQNDGQTKSEKFAQIDQNFQSNPVHNWSISQFFGLVIYWK